MSDPQPGDENIELSQLNEIPYSHREIFLASDNVVGEGLHTHSNLDETGEYSTQLDKLKEKDTLDSIFSSWEAEIPIREDDRILDELLKSMYIRVNNEDKINTAYLEQVTSISRHTNKNVGELLSESNLKTLSTNEIKHVLGMKVLHVALSSDINKVSRLIKLNRNWIKYWKNFTTNLGKKGLLKGLSDEAINQIAIWADGGYEDRTEGNTGSLKSVENYYHNDSRIDSLLNQSDTEDKLLESSPVFTNHPTAIRSISNTQTPYKPRLNTYNGSIVGKYNNQTAVGLLHYSSPLRKTIAAKRSGKSVSDFEFTDLFNQNKVTDKFWTITMGDEILETALQYTQQYYHDDYLSITCSVDVGSDLILTSAADYTYDTLGGNRSDGATANPKVRTHPIDVSDKNDINFSVGGFTESHSNDDRGRESNSAVSIQKIPEHNETGDVGELRWDSGDNPTGEHTINCTDNNKISLEFHATGDSATSGRYSSSISSLEIKSINIT